MQFELDVSYGQIAVFDPSLENPFNDWTERHNSQGFSWRRGSVSFATIENAGRTTVSVRVVEGYRVDSDAARIICVPFSVPASGQVEIASIASSVLLEIPPGDYALFFEHKSDVQTGAMETSLVFSTSTQEPEILKADGLLCPVFPLLMEADPA